ncbi:hypothetical protein LCGC14_0676350 [marine sediment metagenome]|uniref:Uncharacterized protein n=1 Tax=marine sediment metagenome TaxID=412755 RepID=A0A0F9TXG1_9ZZZZ
MLLLHELAENGLLYGDRNTAAEQRMERELMVIGKLYFTVYFPITWDIMYNSHYERRKGQRGEQRYKLLTQHNGYLGHRAQPLFRAISQREPQELS